MIGLDQLPRLPIYGVYAASIYSLWETCKAGHLPLSPAFLSLLAYNFGVALVAAGGVLFAGFVTFVTVMITSSHIASWTGPTVNWSEWVVFREEGLREKYANQRVAINIFIEDYFDQKLDLKVEGRKIFEEKEKLFKMCFGWEHVMFLINKFLPQGIWHGQSMDIDEVVTCYDSQNMFYRSFLGPMMVYTSAIFSRPDESLEDAQRNKLDLVCRKLQMKEGEKHLDIGCGWGTLAVHAAKYFKTQSMGVTLAKDQAAWGKGRAKEAGVSTDPGSAASADFQVMDYRDIPNQKFDKISCLEMAEHVGVVNFPSFMNQVFDMLEEDGLFYLQIAGLRRCWQYEDLIWGMFMGKYVFPAADASCPLAWVVNQLEVAGFEVASHENIGIQYSETISRWLDNCVKNRQSVVDAVGERWYRVWVVFLAWSVMIAKEGGSTCHMLTCHKNKNTFDRRVFVGKVKTPPVTSNASAECNPTLFPKDSHDL